MSEVVRTLLSALDNDAKASVAAAFAPHLAPLMTPLVAQAMDAEGEDGWMTAEEAARYIGRTPQALHKLTAAREIPFHQEGPRCKLYFKRSELDQWMLGGGRRGYRRTRR